MRSERLIVRMTWAELSAAIAAAKADGVGISEWTRRAIRAALERGLD